MDDQIEAMAEVLIAAKDQAACDALVERIDAAIAAGPVRNVDVIVSLCGVLAAEIVDWEIGHDSNPEEGCEAFAKAVCLYLLACVRTGIALKGEH